MSAVQNYLRSAAHAFATEDAQALRSVFSFEGNVQRLLPELHKAYSIERICEQSYRSDETQREMLAGHLQALLAVDKGKWTEAHGHQTTAAKALAKMMKDCTDWVLPLCYAVALNTRRIAEMADKEANGKDGDDEDKESNENKLSDAGRTIQLLFKICHSDKRPAAESKRWGALNLSNKLLYIYAKMNNHQLSRNITTLVATMDFDSYPVSERVTYNFYVGRLALFNGNYKEADEKLSFAFDNCWDRAPRNKRLILVFLLPAKLLRGVLPRHALLDKYSVPQFSDLVEGLRTGDVRRFNAGLDDHQEWFIKKGIYLTVEKLKTLCYRSLFKLTYKIYGSVKVPIQYFQHSLHLCGEEVDADEMECILANLIFKGYMKGYISHERRVLVLSEANAFPKFKDFL